MAYREIYLIIFSEIFIFELPSWMVRACKKIKIGHRAKFQLETNIFWRFFSGSRDFTQDLTSGVLILIHFADAFVLVMACVDCARACR